VLIGVTVAIATQSKLHPAAPGFVATPWMDTNAPRSTAVMVLLAIAWLIDGGVLMRCAALLATSGNAGHMARSLLPLMLFLGAILIASVVIVTTTHTNAAALLALLIAGGPPAFVGVGYGLFMLVILTVGRNARWN
jgi:hypothetical protein